MSPRERPRVALVCHEADRIDAEGLAAWLATSLRLVGVVAIREGPGQIVRRVRREIRRVGLLRCLDVAAFRLYYRVCLARADTAWIAEEVARLRARYPMSPRGVPRLVAPNPNAPEVRDFLRGLDPDLVIARCKFILRPDIFTIARAGTWVLHPGICPEYRNAHGCFWALVNRDLDRVGMTLLRVDEGVDTGPIFLQASYKFDDLRESHVVIQYRVVLENLSAIEATLLAAWTRAARPIPTDGRRSAVWGQPWLSAYLRWKRAARQAAR
ncbi:MAG: formyl transferase [Candidatus Rokuibacteriota bacterium]|nr:MAG: formyl transferase [Candidatus Rokubacteria bacterium]